MIVFKIKELYFSDYKQCVYFDVLKVQEAQKKTHTEKVNYMISSSGSRKDTVEKK